MKVARNVLLVEGKDDQHVIWALLKHHEIGNTFSIEEKGGAENLLKVAPVQLKGSGVDRVGIVLDADVDIAGRWQSVRQLLSSAGYLTVPALPDVGGVVLKQEGLPIVGVWVMPDNSMPGMLEDFVAILVPDDDELFKMACTVVGGIGNDLRRFSSAHISKANIHTWLAWQEDPGTPMGLAITKTYLKANSPSATPFLTWIDRLFNGE